MTKLLFSTQWVIGENLNRGNVIHDNYADGLTILAAGVIGSPKILMLSGMGSPSDPACRGVPVVEKIYLACAIPLV